MSPKTAPQPPTGVTFNRTAVHLNVTLGRRFRVGVGLKNGRFGLYRVLLFGIVRGHNERS